jgi:hypothetical protein
MRAVPAMAAPVSTVEPVQERTGEQQQIREDAEHVSGMLRDDEEGRDPEKGQQHETGARPEPRRRFR